MKNILLNRAKCLNCGEVLISTHRHDFVGCSCGKLAVDGGLDYLRRVGTDYEEQSIYNTDSIEIIRENISRGTYGKNEDEPLRYVLLKDIDDEWLANIISYEQEHRPNNVYLEVYQREQEFRK